MNDFIKLIWKECLEHFGTGTNVDIHVDSTGVEVVTTTKGTSCIQNEISRFRIDGSVIQELKYD